MYKGCWHRSASESLPLRPNRPVTPGFQCRNSYTISPASCQRHPHNRRPCYHPHKTLAQFPQRQRRSPFPTHAPAFPQSGVPGPVPLPHTAGRYRWDKRLAAQRHCRAPVYPMTKQCGSLWSPYLKHRRHSQRCQSPPPGHPPYTVSHCPANKPKFLHRSGNCPAV